MAGRAQRRLPRALNGRAALAAALAAVLVAGAAWSAGGASAQPFRTGIADYHFLSGKPGIRDHWLDRTQAAGAGIVRLNVVWRQIAPTRPARPTDPADRAYRFGGLDAAVEGASLRGMKVMLTVYNAPKWAEGAHPPSSAGEGAWKPSASAYGQFAEALAARYSGHFQAADGTRLPRVKYYEAWNEPNLSTYLAPQWHGKRPASPDLYRRLLRKFYSGVKKGQHGARVIGGAVAPFGDPPGGDRMQPVPFLRGLFCLNAKLKPVCKAHAKLDILSSHPITVPAIGGPKSPVQNPGDIDTADFHLVRNVLRGAERANRVHGHPALWATEFWWATNPPNTQFGVRPRRQAKYVEQTMYLLWKQGAKVAVNLQIVDPPYSRGNTLITSGLFYKSGKVKPSFRSFRFPFVTHRSHGRLAAWGKAPRSGKLKIQKRHGKGWRTVKRIQVHRGEVFNAKLGRHAGGRLRGRVGGVVSMPWH